MICDSLERRRAQMQRVSGNVTCFRQRPYINDRELLKQLLKLEKQMAQEEEELDPHYPKVVGSSCST